MSKPSTDPRDYLTRYDCGCWVESDKLRCHLHDRPAIIGPGADARDKALHDANRAYDGAVTHADTLLKHQLTLTDDPSDIKLCRRQNKDARRHARQMLKARMLEIENDLSTFTGPNT